MHEVRRLVRAEGLEPPRLSPLEPKSSASTSSATPARFRAERPCSGASKASIRGGQAFQASQRRTGLTAASIQFLQHGRDRSRQVLGDEAAAERGAGRAVDPDRRRGSLEGGRASDQGNLAARRKLSRVR